MRLRSGNGAFQVLAADTEKLMAATDKATKGENQLTASPRPNNTVPMPAMRLSVALNLARRTVFISWGTVSMP